MTFYEWYEQKVMPRTYQEQAAYERESVAFTAIEKLTAVEILSMFESMKEADLRLALFDHVRSCLAEQWDPNEPEDEF